MIVVLVAALGSLAGLKQVEFSTNFPRTPVRWDTVLVEASISFVLVVSAAIIVYELAARRFTRVELASQPGFTACAASLVGLLSVFVWWLPLHVRFCIQTGKWDHLFILYYNDIFQSRADTHPLLCNGATCAVAAVWLVQSFGGRWRAVPTWCDRIGRLVGVYWLLRHTLEFIVWNGQ